MTNGGSQAFNKKADLNYLPIEMYYNEDSMANILAMSDVANLPRARIMMDSNKERAILLHYGGHTFKFQECHDGLYYLDVCTLTSTNNTVTNYSYLYLTSTVEQNKAMYTKQDVVGAQRARSWQHIMGWPSDQHFQHIINNNQVNNSPITTDDIIRANKIHGPATPLLQGKMTRSKPLTKQGAQIPPPLTILQNYPNLELFADFFFVNQQPFLLTTSSKLHFLTVQTNETRTKSAIINGLQKVIDTYRKRGFQINDLHGDNEFDMEDLKNALRPILTHIYGVEEHVAPIERAVRTVKERCRAMCHSLPYQKYTKLMVNSLVEYVIYWLNALPATNGVSSTLSPATIVLGRNKPDLSIKHIPFGAYAITYAGTENNMTGRGIPAIALKPSNNCGGNYFMSLLSGKRIHAYKWTEVAIPDEVISKVHVPVPHLMKKN